MCTDILAGYVSICHELMHLKQVAVLCTQLLHLVGSKNGLHIVKCDLVPDNSVSAPFLLVLSSRKKYKCESVTELITEL
jgi:hypothetical protein